MGKCWMFEETGEVRSPKINEWYEGSIGIFVCSPWDMDSESERYPILKLTEFPSNPVERIMKVYEKFKHLDEILRDASWCGDDMGYDTAHVLWQTICQVEKMTKKEK